MSAVERASDYRSAFLNVSVEPAYLLALNDPLLAARTLARGLRQQTPGARRSAIMAVARAVAAYDGRIMADIARDAANERTE